MNGSHHKSFDVIADGPEVADYFHTGTFCITKTLDVDRRTIYWVRIAARYHYQHA